MSDPWHHQEWTQSGSAQDQIALTEESPHDFLPCDNPRHSDERYELPRRSTGDLTNRFLKKYGHLEDGEIVLPSENPFSLASGDALQPSKINNSSQLTVLTLNGQGGAS